MKWPSFQILLICSLKTFQYCIFLILFLPFFPFSCSFNFNRRQAVVHLGTASGTDVTVLNRENKIKILYSRQNRLRILLRYLSVTPSFLQWLSTVCSWRSSGSCTARVQSWAPTATRSGPSSSTMERSVRTASGGPQINTCHIYSRRYFSACLLLSVNAILNFKKWKCAQKEDEIIQCII